MPNRLSWAAVLGLVAASTGCASTVSTGAGGCETDKLPKDDPCYRKACCDTVFVPADGGADGGADAGTTRICGACNG